MQIKGFLATVAGSAAVAALTVLGPTGPASAAGADRIGPGTQVVTAGKTCTVNFVFVDARGRTFAGFAASCATRRAATGAQCARSLPLGTEVRFADRGRTVGRGELRYSSFRALRRAGVTGRAACVANDFALVQVRGASRRAIDPSMPYWDGPHSVAELPATGSMVFGLARPSAGARLLPRAGEVTTVGSTGTVTTLLPSNRAARGSGFLDDSGRAVGILTASDASGSNRVVSLSAAVDYARSHGVAGLRLVPGAGTFTGAAVL